MTEEDFEKDDFFDRAPEPEEPVRKAPKQPALRPDDPGYYEGEESKWEHLQPSRRSRMLWVTLACILLIGGLWFAFIWVFRPVVSEAEEYGYVDNMERRGKIFQTYEGLIIPYKQIKDTARVYDHDFIFTAANDHVAAEIRLRQRSGTPVGVIYKRYNIPFPWRGETTIIVDSVFDVDPTTLLPPDRRPQRP